MVDVVACSSAVGPFGFSSMAFGEQTAILLSRVRARSKALEVNRHVADAVQIVIVGMGFQMERGRGLDGQCTGPRCKGIRKLWLASMGVSRSS